MLFKSTVDQVVYGHSTHFCGDGCCSWTESDTDYVYMGELFEPEFEYTDYFRTDETMFREDVDKGLFVPCDDEANAWYETV